MHVEYIDDLIFQFQPHLTHLIRPVLEKALASVSLRLHHGKSRVLIPSALEGENHPSLQEFGLPQVFNNMAGQIDIFPSLMGFLNIPYTNNTPGIDLFSEERPYIFFNGDDKYGVINREWFLIVKEDKSKGLYKYRKKDKFNYAETMPEQVNKMQKYAASHLQACQYVIDNKKQ